MSQALREFYLYMTRREFIQYRRFVELLGPYLDPVQPKLFAKPVQHLTVCFSPKATDILSPDLPARRN